jgi:serine/threonine-protein kinase HipA
MVFYNQVLAGFLRELDGEFHFHYTEAYLADPSLPAIALAFPKVGRTFNSKVLFPFFCGLLSEGANMQLQCQLFKIDEEDFFTRLLKTATSETIGAITVREIVE